MCPWTGTSPSLKGKRSGSNIEPLQTGRVNPSATMSKVFLLVVLLPILFAGRTIGGAHPQQNREQSSVGQTDNASAELQTAITLTRRGKFTEAIPRLLALQGRVADDYAVKFNLALCYVAVGEPAKAIPVLQSLPDDPRRGPNVDNLLAQAYIGSGQADAALSALQRGAKKSPNNEKLFLYAADACMAYQDYALGLKAMNLGLQQLPQSAALHYEKAVFLALLDNFDVAKQEFDRAHELAPDNAIGYVAAAHKDMMSGNMEGAVRVAREGVRKGKSNYLLLTFLAQALIRSGAVSGQPEFAEARSAAEKAVAERPNYADSQLVLANVYLMENRSMDALAHLEAARELEPRRAAVYSNLATIYRRLGKKGEAEEALSILRAINQEQVARIANAPGEVKAGYGRTPH